MRIDKFLWCIRLAKTRSIAQELCSKERVFIKGISVKPSKEIQIEEVLKIKINPIFRTYQVLAIPKSRIGAKDVFLYIKEITLTEDLAKLEASLLESKQRSIQGFKGRPTKKDRRSIEPFVTL
jgi:ribosome-associated heat shock protein Hsp15